MAVLTRNILSARRTLRSTLDRAPGALALVLFATAVACSGSEGSPESESTGGTASTLGGSGAVNAGGASSTSVTVGGSTAAAGTPAKGGAAGAGGSTTTSEPQTGGVAPIGGATARGGSSAKGGTSAVGSTTAKGGTTASGGTSARGGSTGTGGGAYCSLPTKFKWTTSGALAKVPRTIDGHNVIALKDFTHVVHNDKHIVYATAYEGNWKSAMFVFDDWSKWDATAGVWFPRNAVAPTLIYFTPKKQWVLLYQWGFQYATSNDPTNASSWSAGKSLLSNGPSSAIDQTFICDTTNCYLFFAGDNGKIYRSSMPIGSFPSTFNGYQTIMTDTQARLFEAVQVYTVKGPTPLYLMIVEAMGGGGRYFRAFTATDLGGQWTAMPSAETEASPFAGKANVTGTLWSNDISHGDLVRTDPSETQPIDPCNLQLLYQGFDKTKSASGYGTIPYQPGLLTLVR